MSDVWRTAKRRVFFCLRQRVKQRKNLGAQYIEKERANGGSDCDSRSFIEEDWQTDERMVGRTDGRTVKEARTYGLTIYYKCKHITYGSATVGLNPK